jgi:hypothetical protein
MRGLVAVALLAACSEHHAPVPAPDSAPATEFACDTSAGACSIATQYCYIGELASGTYYPQGTAVQEGCNAFAAGCTSCDCLMQTFSPGFCSCETSALGTTVHCSLAVR